MILKKPYAFLIKNFRLIHIILAVLIGYLTFKTYNIYSFLARYVSNVYALGNESSTYVSIFMFLTVIVIIAFSLAMFMLMRSKNKPRNFYIALSVYYTIYFVTLIGLFVAFKSMETASLDMKVALTLRDYMLLMLVPEVAFLLIALVRGLGFDIKRFNFSKDLKELDISDKDSEEFEFVLGVDTYKYSRKLHRMLREFKYYYLENKFLFTLLFGLLIGILLIIVIFNFLVFNRTYHSGQTFIANNLSIKVNSSYLTNEDYRGNIIDSKKYFLILNTTFTNNSGSSTVLDLTNYKLKINGESTYPVLTRNKYFIDLGKGYSKEKILSNTTKTYILVYEIPNKDVKDKYKFDILDSVEYKAGSINAKVKHMTLRPYRPTKKVVVGTYNLGKEVNFYDSILNNSKLKVDGYEFMDKFTYKYEACVRNSCDDITDVVIANQMKEKTLIVLDAKLELDKTSDFVKGNSGASFYDAFVSVSYDGKIAGVSDVTPKSLVDKTILEVSGDVKNAGSVRLVVTIRDKKYNIVLK